MPTLPPGASSRSRRAEVLRPELVADGLDHLDGDDGVVRRPLLDGAVVPQLDLDPVRHPRSGDARPGELELLGREGDAADDRAAMGGPDRELAPAGADLEEPGAGADARAVEEPFDLADLGLRQRLGRGLASGRDRHQMPVMLADRGVEQRGRVAERLVEEGREQVVGEVVVVGDVVAAVGGRAALRPRRPRHHEGAGLLQRRRDEGRQVGGQHRQEAGEVVGVPGLGHVGLAEADQAVAAQPGEELVGPAHGHRRAALTEDLPVAVG